MKNIRYNPGKLLETGVYLPDSIQKSNNKQSESSCLSRLSMRDATLDNMIGQKAQTPLAITAANDEPSSVQEFSLNEMMNVGIEATEVDKQ